VLYGYDSGQKVIIDWILSWAFRYLKALLNSTKITLGANLKHCTKAKWTKMLDEGLNDHLKYEIDLDIL
jgi:hypothetical protein